MFVVNDGFSLKASGGNIATGCTTPGPGLAVPKAGNDYDYATLTDCAKKLKDASADFKDETQVTITANPGIDYQTLIRAIDALRRSKDGDELFPRRPLRGAAMTARPAGPPKAEGRQHRQVQDGAAQGDPEERRARPRSTSSTSRRCST